MRNNFAVFICTHGRPSTQYTRDSLIRCGYTGKIYLVLDDTDPTIQQYIDIYGTDSLVVFDKNHYINSDKYDNGTNAPKFKCIVYAKRAVEDIAKSMGYNHFAIADDDMTDFTIRFPTDEKLATYKIHDLDSILDIYCDIACGPVAGVGFGYITSYLVGKSAFEYPSLSSRKLPYQFVIRNGKIPVIWESWFAEDDITELQSSYIGNIWLSIPHIKQVTKTIGDISGEGGMADIYKQNDTFKLNFNILKCCPQRTYFTYRKGKPVISRKTDSCFPKLISDVYRK